MKHFFLATLSCWIRLASAQFFIGNDALVTNHASTISFTGSVHVLGTILSTGSEYAIASDTQQIVSLGAHSQWGIMHKSNQGDLSLYGDMTCHQFIFTTDGHVIIYDTLRIIDSDSIAVSGYSHDRFFDVGNHRGHLARFFTDTFSKYVFPIGNKILDLQPVIIEPISFGASGPGWVMFSLHEGVLGTIEYDSLFNSGFSFNDDGCIYGSDGFAWSLGCLADVTWIGSGPSDYDFVIRASSFRCGQPPFRVITTRDSLFRWGNDIDDGVGNFEENLCHFSTWDHYGPIVGGVYRGIDRYFAIAGSAGFPLPVTDFDVYAKPRDALIDVHWSTGLQINSQSFTVMKSLDGIHFLDQTVYQGCGTCHDKRQYVYHDDDIVPHVRYYYRIDQRDVDGSITRSRVVSAMITQDVQVTCFDITGRFLGNTHLHEIKDQGAFFEKFRTIGFLVFSSGRVKKMF